MGFVGRFGRRSFQPARVKTTTAPTATALDQTPDAFLFTAVSGADTTTLQTSNQIAVLGIDAGAILTATVSGDASSQMQRNGGAWTSSQLVAQVGDLFAVRHTSSASASTEVSTTLTIGGVSATFRSTTATAPGSDDGVMFLFSASQSGLIALLEDI